MAERCHDEDERQGHAGGVGQRSDMDDGIYRGGGGSGSGQSVVRLGADVRSLFVSIVETFSRTIRCPIIITAIIWQKLLIACSAYDWRSATFPVAIVLARGVNWSMFSISHQDKILYPVILSIAVYVVYHLITIKRAINAFAHYKTMFSYIPRRTMLKRIRMIWSEQINIPVGRNKTASKPARVILPSEPVTADITNFIAALNPKQCSLTWLKLLITSAFTFHVSIPFNSIIPHLIPL